MEGLQNILYHNNGDGTFTDVSASSGIAKYVGKGMGVAFADYDNDGGRIFSSPTIRIATFFFIMSRMERFEKPRF